ncbi:hypothetical protein BGZ76_002961 [Entomortierella beljakovae]|nr:hypothetical protein BGZ76_002961 [Entomortierella beljakovae]
MASIESANRNQQHRYGPSSSSNSGGNGAGNANGGQFQSYMLYPDPPAPARSKQQDRQAPSQHHHQQQQQQQQQRNYADLTPQNSFSSTNSQNNNNNNKSQLGFLRSPAPVSTSSGQGYTGNAPPSPISPSTPDALTSHLSLTHIDEPVQDRLVLENYDQSKYKQPRKKSIGASHQPQQHQLQQRHQQLQEEEASYGGNLKQSGSSGSSRSVASQGQGQGRELKQSSSSTSAHSLNSLHNRDDRNTPPSLRQSPSGGSAYSNHSQRELKQSGSSASAQSVSSSRTHPLSSSHSNGSNAPSPSRRQQQQQQQNHYQQNDFSSSPPSGGLSYLQVDHDDDKDRGDDDSEEHQQQALKYQQNLQQKPPSTHGDDDSDDSDSGSMLSYRRSINRLSMSYKRTTGGAPNISLFTPGQRSVMMNSGASSGYNNGGAGQSSALTESQRMIQEQREERIRQQQQQQQRPRQDEGRPAINRSGSSPYQPPQRELQIPERSTSADSYNNTRSRQQQQQQQQQQSQSHQGYSGGRSNPSSPSMAHRQIDGHSQGHFNHEQRSRPDRLNLSPNDSMAPRSRSPAPMGAPPRTPGSPMPGQSGPGGSGGSGGVYRQNGYPGGLNASSSSLPLPSPRGANFGASSPNGSGAINPHPAHHLAAGGYVRPEEAMGPSNPMPEKAEDFVRQGIEFHEIGDTAKATHFFRTAAELGDPVGMLMFGLSVRHGWGCSANRVLAFQYLQKSAEHAVGDLKSRDSFASTAAKGELVLAIYELGVCFRHGWGIDKNKKTAAYYFEIAANLGDPDAQNDLAWCYYHGVGVKKDMYKSAKYYRLAAAQGLNTVGNSWIWKDKYGGVPASPALEQ